MSTPGETARPMPAPAATRELPWRRLDPRMLVIRPVHDLIRLLPLLVGALLVGRDGTVWEWAAPAIAGLAVVGGVVRCVTTRYRVSAAQVEWRTGLVRRRHRAVPRDRIRTVDVTAELKHRLFGLRAVHIGTGRHGHGHDDELVLDAVSLAEAQRLRATLLHRKAAAEPRADAERAAAGRAEGRVEGTVEDAAGTAGEVGEHGETMLAEVDPRWVRYAPFTLSGLAAVAAAVGAGYHLVRELHVDPVRLGPLRALVDRFADAASWVSVLAVMLALLVVVSLASVAGYVLAYWNFRLTREAGGSLHVRRGLVTTRSVSLDERRLRGVELKEPLPLRAAGGAWVVAVAGGLRTARAGERGGGGGGVLLPPAPAERARRVAADVLGEPGDPAGTALRRHPRAALPRRLTRAVGGVLLPAGILYLLGRFGVLPASWWQLALAASPLAALVGWDRYRNLGHAVVGRYLVCRTGSLRRRTVLLRRDGIIGWQLHQSFFQRRQGLITLVATVPAGRGAYEVPDMAETDAIALADEAVPGLLAPFLERARMR